ncbi:MAG: Gfo/Idh/MocA family protein [Thermomicrobiales bacterium]
MKRLGVIGYGGRIRGMLATIDRFDTDATVVAVVDPAEEALRARFPEKLVGVTFYPDVDAMLETANLDGVLIGTNCLYHTPYAVKVLATGLPLFLEKPVAIDEAQLADLHAASLATTSKVVVSFPLRVSRLCTTAKEVVDSGVLGTVENIQMTNNVPFYGSNYYHGWMRNEALTGGLWLQKATHDLDYLNYLVDSRTPARIVAVESKNVFTGEMPAGLYCMDCALKATCPESQYNLFYKQGILADLHDAESFWDGRWQCAFAVDTGNHDAATAIVQYPSGAHATYTQMFYARRGAAKRGAILTGYKGTLSFDWYTEEVVVHHHHVGRVERIAVSTGEHGHSGGDHELAHDFLAILYGTGESRATLQDGLLSAQMCLMAKRSCQENAFQPFVPLGSETPVLTTR